MRKHRGPSKRTWETNGKYNGLHNPLRIQEILKGGLDLETFPWCCDKRNWNKWVQYIPVSVSCRATLFLSFLCRWGSEGKGAGGRGRRGRIRFLISSFENMSVCMGTHLIHCLRFLWLPSSPPQVGLFSVRLLVFSADDFSYVGGSQLPGRSAK